MKRYIIFGVLLVLCAVQPMWAQAEPDSDPYYEQNYESGEQRIHGGWGFNVQISSTGFVLGTMYSIKPAKYTFFSTSLDMFWVRGKDEQQAINPYTGYIETINSETILMLPLQFSVKRRILGESISNTLRPFVMFSAGVVKGWYFDGDISRSRLDSVTKFDFRSSQFAPTASLGFGADFGKPGQSAYGLDLKYQFLRFPNHLGLRKRFDNFQLGFHMNF
ncbi:hypothetical protein F9K33_00655 [bacterium]|nr:MAG: hypothetical protein F9K33_00655 [bacterium]